MAPVDSIIPFWCQTLVNTPSKHDVDPMLFQCWPTICDAGPTSNHHWLNASCLLGCAQPSKHKMLLFCVLCGVFWNVLKSKKLQVRDYLFKWTEFFRIKYARSCVVGLPNHPQLLNYMTQHYNFFYTIVIFGEWLIEQTLALCCFNVGPTSSPVAPMKYKHVVTSPFIIPSKH